MAKFSILLKPFRYYKCILVSHRHDFAIPRVPPAKNFNGYKLVKKFKKDEKDSDSVQTHSPTYLQIVGTGAEGGARSLLLNCSSSRYIFNVGESTQRIMSEYKLGFSQIDNIFITNSDWSNIGGLPGLILTIEDTGSRLLTLHGPKDLNAIFLMTNGFSNAPFLKVKMANCYETYPFFDQNVAVHYVPLMSNEYPKLEILCNSKSEEGFDLNSKSACTQQNEHNLNDLLYSTSMAYICRMKPIRGTLDLTACVDKNVPPGPLLAKLNAGQDIKLKNGTVVKAAEVRTPDLPGGVFIVIDCPNESFLESLQAEKAFIKHQCVNDESDIPKYVIHFTPSSIMENEMYQNWMKKFPSTTLHIDVNDYNDCLGLSACYEAQYKLNVIDDKIFPLLKPCGIPSINLPTCDNEEQLNNVSRVQFNFPDSTATTLRCLPLSSMNHCSKNILDVVYLTPDEYVRYVTSSTSFNETVRDMKLKLEKLPVVQNPRLFPRITMLGTGSSNPSKYRNVSGILVSLRPNSHLLLDCGEGSYGQIIRHFGLLRAQEIIAHTNLIFISHMHVDHHLGLITILNKRRKALRNLGIQGEPLTIAAPHLMSSWLNSYNSEIENILSGINLIPNDYFNFKKKAEHVHLELLSTVPLSDFITCEVNHCRYAFGVSFTDLNGIKITYSGDATPEKNLINIGRKSNLLIHEATFEDELWVEAAATLHSTFGQAIGVGRNMEADFTLLTHFSQRYPKIPPIGSDFDEKVGIAFDHMEVTLDDLPKLPLFKNMLKLIYSDTIEFMEIRREKRMRLTTLLTEC